MLEYVRQTVKLNEQYANAHLADIPADQWCRQAEGLPMHPASIVGHIVICCELTRVELGGEPILPASWRELFEEGAAAAAEPSAYPPKDELLAALTDQRQRMVEILASTPEADLARPLEHEEMREVFGSLGTMLFVLLLIHEPLHLGQLSSWRRAVGMPLHI